MPSPWRWEVGFCSVSPRPYVGNKVPRLRWEETLPLYQALRAATEAGLVRSASTPARGGWALAFARCVMAGELGLDLELDDCPEMARLTANIALFSESAGRFLVTTSAESAEPFERAMNGVACRLVGTVTADARLRVRYREEIWLDVDSRELKTAFKKTLADE